MRNIISLPITEKVIPMALLRLHLALVVSCLSACSTVNFKVDEKAASRDSIQATRILRNVAGAPFAALGAFAHKSKELLENAGKLASSGRGDDAAASYLEAAFEARELLAGGKEPLDSESQKALLAVHNGALAQFAELWVKDSQSGKAVLNQFTSNGKTIELKWATDSDFAANYFDRLVPSESVKGKGVVEKARAGYGAALFGIREQRPERAEELKFYPRRGLHCAVTLVMEDSSRAESPGTPAMVTVALRNPMLHETVSVNGRKFPLAANFSNPFAMLLAGHNELLLGLGGFFNADKRIRQSGVFLLEPYDPERIPVVLTHGLVSVPIIWRDLIPELMSDPEIARRYQFMMFTYPSSYMISESALLFREQLAAVRTKYDPQGKDPLSNNMVAVGHSMGGMLTHLLVAEIGENYWNQISDVPLQDLDLSPELKTKVRALTYFDPDPAVRRAVFLSTPHRGAKMAQASISGFISRFVRLPVDVLELGKTLLTLPVTGSLKVDMGQKMTSVQSLEPDSPVVKALDASPYKKGVAYHSIIGDRGKGNTPESSDGAVEYWSSHQEGAASELIVPTGHTSYTHPESIAEIKRILRLHVGIK
jgi:pimeloyl-ACP methyl ester carboxylesterase